MPEDFDNTPPDAIAIPDALKPPGSRAPIEVRTISFVQWDLSSLDPTTNSVAGVTCDAGDLFVLAGQDDPNENGVYLADGSVPAPRASIADSSGEINSVVRVLLTDGQFVGDEFIVFPSERPFSLNAVPIVVRRDPEPISVDPSPTSATADSVIVTADSTTLTADRS